MTERMNLTEWERCPKRHGQAQHLLDCEPAPPPRSVEKEVLQGIARLLGYDPNEVVEVHATARDVEVIVVDRSTGDEASHLYLVQG